MSSSHSVSRRDVLAAAGALPLAMLVRTPQRRVPVGLGLFSVRTELTRDLPGTVTAVARMGYEVVEFYTPYLQWTPAMAKDVRKLLDDLGIATRSTHNNVAAFSGDGLKRAIELNQIIGSRIMVLPNVPGVTDIPGWTKFAADMTAVCEQLRPLGMTAGFHNHEVQWKPVDGRRPIDVIAAGTPRDFVMQLDVGTCMKAGADPVAFVRANPGRVRSLHCKDWGAGEGRDYAVAFGEGDTPWRALFAASEEVGGVECYLIEQEVSPPGQALAMAERCLANYRRLRA